MVSYTNHLRIAKANFDQSPWHQDFWAALDQIDNLIYNALLTAGTVAWTNSHAFVAGQSALDTVTGAVFTCGVSHTSAVSPTTFAQDRVAHPTYWVALVAGLTFRGAWAQLRAYNILDVVYDSTQGIAAMCIVTHTSTGVGSIRTDAANWVFLIDTSTILNASGIAFTPVSTLLSTDVQSAIAEVMSNLVTDSGRITTQQGQIDANTLAIGSNSATLATVADEVATLQLATSGDSVVHKNYIINGGMQVSQENGAAAGSSTLYYAADGWVISRGNGGTANFQQVAAATPQGSTHRLRYTVTSADAAVAAGDFAFIITCVEGLSAAALAYGTASARTITLEFGVKAPAGTYGVALYNSAANRYYVGQYTISVGEANTDVVKAIVITGDLTGTWLTDTGMGIGIAFTLMAGSTYQGVTGSWQAGNVFGTSSQFNFMGTNGNVFELFDVELCEGTQAAGFNLEPYEITLRRCQRYYWKRSQDATLGASDIIAILQAITTSSAIGKIADLPVEMRIDPTVTVSAVGGVSLTNAAGVTTVCNALTFKPTTKSIGVNTAAVATTPLVAGNATTLLFTNAAAASIAANARFV